MSNVERREDERMGPPFAVPVYHFDVPADDAAVFESVYLTGSERARVLVEKEGRRWVRFYVPQVPGIPLRDLRRKVRLEQSYWAVQMQGHSTFFVWDPDAPREAPFILKAQRHLPMRKKNPDGKWIWERNLFNHADSAETSIRNNDVIEALLRADPDPMVGYLPEHFAAAFESGKTTYAYILRSLRPLSPAPLGPRSLIYPLHGLLGDYELGEKLASAAGLKSRADWILEKYLPALGRYLARMHYRYGLHLTAHSQNLLVEIDWTTGEIAAFHGKDANDMLFNSYLPEAMGRSAQDGSIAGHGTSRVHQFFVDESEDGPRARDPGPHLRVYGGQAILLSRSRSLNARGLRNFRDAYLAEIVEILGHRVSFDDVIRETEKLLAVPQKPGDRDPAWKALERLGQATFERVTKEITPALIPGMREFRQQELAKVFERHRKLWDSTILAPEGYDRLFHEGAGQVSYAFDGRFLRAVQWRTGKLLGVVYRLTERDLRDIYRAARSGRARALCPWEKVAKTRGAG